MNPPAEESARRSPGEAINPPGFPHVGYSNGVVSDGNLVLAIAGQTDMAPSGQIRNPGNLVAQVEGCFGNIAAVLKAADARPTDMTRMRIFVVDVEAYKAANQEIGASYREHFGKWYPAMTLVQVARLYDDEALVEIEADAVI